MLSNLPTSIMAASSAPSWWTTASQTIPIAALTTVAFTWFLARILARRQEFGKKQAEAELKLRQLLREVRADILHARAGLAENGSYHPQGFTGERLEIIAAQAVVSAHRLPKRKRKALRVELVRLLGEWRVRMAEEMGTALLKSLAPEPTSGPKEASLVPARRPTSAQAGWYAMHAGGGGDVTEGLLHDLSKSQIPAESHQPVVDCLDRALKTIGGSTRLDR
ncbi:hypothetical protein [Streptomyces sp. NPDC047981]|uniref:hypothetical protein n=1 Tax=Streptomyces sp. NPDC047981 TaxID=3154610 RepID=UPI0034376A24